MYWFFPGKMLPCISALHWAHLRTWFVIYGGRSSILHYGPLIETIIICRITDKFPPEHIPSHNSWHLGHIPSCHFSTPDIFPPVVFPSGTYFLPSFFHPIHFPSRLYIHVIIYVLQKSEIKHFIDLTQIETSWMFCTEIKLFVTIIENSHVYTWVN